MKNGVKHQFTLLQTLWCSWSVLVRAASFCVVSKHTAERFWGVKLHRSCCSRISSWICKVYPSFPHSDVKGNLSCIFVVLNCPIWIWRQNYTYMNIFKLETARVGALNMPLYKHYLYNLALLNYIYLLNRKWKILLYVGPKSFLWIVKLSVQEIEIFY